MELYFTGIIIAVSTFLIIGIFHPIVIKVEYYWGTRQWWVFLILGIVAILVALMVANVIVSSNMLIIRSNKRKLRRRESGTFARWKNG